MDREIKKSELVNQCTSITIEKIDRLFFLVNKNEFQSKHGVYSLMVGGVEEIRREISEIWKMFLTENRLVDIPNNATQSDTPPTETVNKEEST